MAGYNRISPNPFVDGAIIEATDFDTEFGALDTAFGTSGHTHDGTDGNGPKIDTTGLALNAVDSTILDETDSSYAVAGMTIDSLTITSGTAVTSIDTDLSSVSASDDTLASAKAIKTYVDNQLTASDLDFQGDSGGALSIDLDSETLTIAGGTGLTTTGSGNTLTVDIDSTVATLTGTQTLTNKTLSSPAITGNLTTDGTIDGRDIATDGTKLDGIETGATADQTAAEIKTAYESNSDTNAFTDAEQTKLSGIETGADVTDATNVTAAGALMDSEVTNLAQVKAFDSSDYATSAQGTLADSAVQPSDNISTLTNDSGFITGNQTITLSGDATGSGTTAITVALAADTVGVDELNLTDGTAGQFLKTDGAGNISFATAPTQSTSFTVLDVDNINLDGNTISSTDTDGDIVLKPNGSGDVELRSGGGVNIELQSYAYQPGPTYTTTNKGFRIKHFSENTAAVKTLLGQLEWRYESVTSGSESSSFYLFNRKSGSTQSLLASSPSTSYDLKCGTNLRFDSGKGIDFSATSDATGMTSELLDDYEEGTWTPAISTASGSFTTLNIQSSTCSYVKIGKQVTVQGAFNTSDVSIGTALGALRITGIPFTPANNHARGSCYGALLAGETPIHVGTNSSSNCLTLWYVSSATADPSQLQASDLTTGSGTYNVIRFTITYEVS